MHFTVEAQRMIREHVSGLQQSSPLVAVDATAGNGHDTAFLADLVGKSGRVIAIDIQQSALLAAQQKLAQLELSDRVDWHHSCHSELDGILRSYDLSQIDVAMFNLGYLPYGDRSIRTHSATSLAALQTVWNWLRPEGLISIICYPAHQGGREEHQVVSQWIDELANLPSRPEVESYIDRNHIRSPQFWMIRKPDGKQKR